VLGERLTLPEEIRAEAKGTREDRPRRDEKLKLLGLCLLPSRSRPGTRNTENGMLKRTKRKWVGIPGNKKHSVAGNPVDLRSITAVRS